MNVRFAGYSLIMLLLFPAYVHAQEYDGEDLSEIMDIDGADPEGIVPLEGAELFANYDAVGNCSANRLHNLSGTPQWLFNYGDVRLRINCALNVPATVMESRAIQAVRVVILDRRRNRSVDAQLCMKHTGTQLTVRCGGLEQTSTSATGPTFLDLTPPEGAYASGWMPFVSVSVPARGSSGMSGIGALSVWLEG